MGNVKVKKSFFSKYAGLKCRVPPYAGTIATLAVLFYPNATFAFNLYDGSDAGNNLEVNLTTTLDYSAAYRVNNPSKLLTTSNYSSSAQNLLAVNTAEGDLDFRHGFFSNEIDALPVLDIRDGNYGMHVSGDFYINTPYLGTNQDNQPENLNPYTVGKSNDFTSGTRNVNGEYARLLDAFAFAQHPFGNGQMVSLKVGRQTLTWGQSLFFAQNGISGAMAPIDIITAQGLPNPQTQQVLLPTGQVVVTYQPGNGITLQAYYQFEEQHDLFQGVGAYFSNNDFLDAGGERIIPLAGQPLYLFRAHDLNPPSQNGEFGASVQDELGNYDVGLFALRYDAKTPEIYATVTGVTPTPNGTSLGNYRLVYPRDIQLYGTSLSSTIGPVNVAGEVSGRINEPLYAQVIQTPAGNTGNASNDPLYPVGNTLHAQASELYLSPALPLAPGGVQIDSEVEFNHVIHVSANKDQLTPGRQASAAAFETVITPTYNDVLPNLNVTVPVGFTYDFLGRSQIDQTMNHGTGEISVGVTGTYKSNWIAGLTYNNYFGKPDLVTNPLADRGYVSFNLQHTF